MEDDSEDPKKDLGDTTENNSDESKKRLSFSFRSSSLDEDLDMCVDLFISSIPSHVDFVFSEFNIFDCEVLLSMLLLQCSFIFLRLMTVRSGSSRLSLNVSSVVVNFIKLKTPHVNQ